MQKHNILHGGRRNFLKLSALSTLGSMLHVPALAARSSALPPVDSAGPNILLRSSWNDYNIGDIGHTPGTLRLLERYVPEANITLWHAAPRPITEALIKKNFPKVKIINANFNDEVPDPVLVDAFSKTNLYIHNSGMSMNFGLFGYEWGGVLNNLAPMYYCLDKGIPFGLYGQSFDKFAHPSLYVFKDVLNRAAFIYCRDTESMKFLQENKFKTPVLEFGPDGCFGIDVRDEARGLKYLQDNRLENQKFLAVIIRTNTSKAKSGTGNLLNPVVPTAEQQSQDKNRLQKVRALITHWVRNTGLKVLLAPEADKEIVYARQLVYDALDKDVQKMVVCRDTFWSADEAMSVYARAHTMFGMEPHSLIMGVTLGVPVIHARPLAHGRKGWMFRDIGLPEWLFEVDQAGQSEMINAMMAIHKDYPAARAKVKNAMAVVTARQSATMKVVRKVMGLS